MLASAIEAARGNPELLAQEQGRHVSLLPLYGLLALLATVPLFWVQEPGQALGSAAFVAACIFVVPLAVRWRSWTSPAARGAIQVFMGALALRVAAVGLVALLLMAKNGTLFVGGDDLFYHEAGNALARGNLRYYTPENNPGYYYLTALVYSTIGDNTVLMRLLNALAAALTVLPTFRIGTTLFGERQGLAGARLLALFPDHIYYSSLHLKDAIVVFLATCLIALAVSSFADRRRRLSSVLAIAVVMAAIWPIRAVLAVGLAAVLACGSLIKRNHSGLALVLAAVSIVGTSRYLQTFSAFSERVGGYFNEQTRATLRGRVAAAVGNDAADSSLGIKIFGQESRNTATGLAMLAVGYAVFWIMPFPPLSLPLSVYDVCTTSLGVFVWYVMLPYSAFGIWRTLHDRRQRIAASAPLLFCLFIPLAMAVSGSVTGGASRYRLMIIPPLLVFAALGRHLSLRDRSWVTRFAGLVFGSATVAYCLLKYVQ